MIKITQYYNIEQINFQNKPFFKPVFDFVKRRGVPCNTHHKLSRYFKEHFIIKRFFQDFLRIFLKNYDKRYEKYFITC